MKLADTTIEQIRADHEGCYIQTNDAGLVYDYATNSEVRALDVLVWASEEESEDDDGTHAIARYIIRASA